jgi:hypothetical protein
MALDRIVVAAAGGAKGPKAVAARVHECCSTSGSGTDPQPTAVGLDSEDRKTSGRYCLHSCHDIVIVRCEMQVRPELVMGSQVSPGGACFQEFVYRGAPGVNVGRFKGRPQP